MNSRSAFVLAVCTATLSCAASAATTTVVDLPTRGTTVRILHVRADAPVAHLVALAGGAGTLLVRNDGSMASAVAGCNAITRNRQSLADHGFSVALVDAAADGRLFVYDDLVEIVRHLQARDAVPTWVTGTSASTEVAVDLLARLPLGGGLGGIVYSPTTFDAAQVASITAPTLIIAHQLDPLSRPGTFAGALTSTPIVQVAILSGGSNGACTGYHQFNGLDEPFLAAIYGFVDQHNPALKFAPFAQPAVAVEFYHAQLDHYFLTHVADEVALLDAGTTIKGWMRTGETFHVHPTAQAGTSPVCRYYIPPGKGDSHFYGRGTVECAATGAANPSFVNEDAQFFHVVLPTTGACPSGMVAVYRVFSNRPDANHRYMMRRHLRDEMVGKGWLAEGDGDDLVVMCVPA